jgi:hypothetical protein
MVCLFRFEVQILQNYVSALKNLYPTIHFSEMIDQLDDMKCENKKNSKWIKMELVGKAKLDEYGFKKLKA